MVKDSPHLRLKLIQLPAFAKGRQVVPVRMEEGRIPRRTLYGTKLLDTHIKGKWQHNAVGIAIGSVAEK